MKTNSFAPAPCLSILRLKGLIFLSVAALLIFTLFSSSLFCQNLVPNGNFEGGTCAQVGSSGGGFAPWFTVGPSHTADAFGRCGNTPGPGGGCCGGGAGIQVRSKPGTNLGNWVEYLEIQLTTPLVAGQTYCVEFYAATRNNVSTYTFIPIDKIGAYFSPTKVSGLANTAGTYTSGGTSGWVMDKVTPQIVNTPGNWITKSSCVKISGSFVAAGGEQYMVIGNFSLAANTPCQNGSDCDSYVSIDNVSVTAGACSPPFSLTATPLTSNICTPQCVTLTANPVGENGIFKYSWSPGGATTQSISACPTTTTNYTVTVTSTKGCATKTLNAVVTVNVSSCSNPSVTANNVTVCSAGGCTNITAIGSGGQNPYTYSWTPGPLAGSTVNVCPSSSTTYTVIITDGAGATGSNTASVSIGAGLTPTITGNTTICAGQTTTLTGNGGTSYSWNTGATTNSITVTPNNTITYSITATTGGCTGSAIATVTVTQAPIPTISGATIICSGQSTTLTATGGGTYSWNTSETTQSIT
ncbi:MAG: hypothetical protein H0W84_14585, partial [Bacteroidetes bacterium]|nr:hypothetical protein [Bacteroidota bacterium]